MCARVFVAVSFLIHLVKLAAKEIDKQAKCEIACSPTPLISWVPLFFLIFANQQSKKK